MTERQKWTPEELAAHIEATRAKLSEANHRIDHLTAALRGAQENAGRLEQELERAHRALPFVVLGQAQAWI